MAQKEKGIHPEMTVIDTITRYRETEHVFKKFDERAGACICCEALFDTILVVAEKFHLELDSLLSELNTA
ncbi:MAG: hypothetical protein JXB09_06495, partial [Deltaproteobacteria bacterium]|nr:hypothetical protein [Deltaproteobacteria bacterium]